MKIVIRILSVIVVSLLIIGYYLKDNQNPTGNFIIGISVLILAFLLMPLFIYHRYKGKDLSRYMFTDLQGQEKKTDKETND